MTVIGFQFTKILAEKLSATKGKISIQNNVSITSVEEVPMMLKNEKQKSLKFGFEYISKYEPKYGKIELAGDLIWLEDAKKAGEIVTSWKKDKKIAQDIARPIINTVMTKANIEALIISREVNFPPPIKLPKLKEN